LRSELLALTRRAYEASPAYHLPSLALIQLGRKEFIQDSTDDREVSHQTIADELLFLGLMMRRQLSWQPRTRTTADPK